MAVKKGQKINYPQKRCTSTLHTVTAHLRQGAPVCSFERGPGRKFGVLKTSLKIERKLNITITMPQICHFCGEEITKKYGRESDSLVIHSLDGDHNNWIRSNKMFAHHGCHVSFHNGGSIRDAKKAWRTRRERYPPNGMKPKEAN